jgi:hypothetical protein
VCSHRLRRPRLDRRATRARNCARVSIYRVCPRAAARVCSTSAGTQQEQLACVVQGSRVRGGAAGGRLGGGWRAGSGRLGGGWRAGGGRAGGGSGGLGLGLGVALLCPLPIRAASALVHKPLPTCMHPCPRCPLASASLASHGHPALTASLAAGGRRAGDDHAVAPLAHGRAQHARPAALASQAAAAALPHQDYQDLRHLAATVISTHAVWYGGRAWG